MRPIKQASLFFFPLWVVLDWMFFFFFFPCLFASRKNPAAIFFTGEAFPKVGGGFLFFLSPRYPLFFLTGEPFLLENPDRVFNV